MIKLSKLPYKIQFYNNQHMEEEQIKVEYNFIKEYLVHYGWAIYVTGSIPVLGGWNISKAIKLQCKYQKYWVSQVKIPIQQKIEYKYFSAPFELNKEPEKYVKWIDSHNQVLHIPFRLKNKFSQQDSSLLKIMSFNVRLETERDQGQISWEARKDNCCDAILEHFPDTIGVQQPKNNQRKYINSRIGSFYKYYGKPRDLKQNENSGIFVRKDKFIVIQDNYIWINETKTPGKPGFEARLPRYYTILILEPVCEGKKWIIHINTHLDHQSNLARREGVKMIAESIRQKFSQYGSKLRNAFVTGDFNISDTNPMFKQLTVDCELLPSLRYILPVNDSDYEQTFNGFWKRKPKKNEKQKANLMIIDHIFVKISDYAPLKFQVLRGEDKILSDHYPIIGYFRSLDKQQK